MTQPSKQPPYSIASHVQHGKSAGFTIVELLIVILVIGILATLILIAYGNIQAQARDVKRKGDASSIRDAAISFKSLAGTNSYPAQGASFATDVATVSSVKLQADITSKIGTGAPTAATADTADNTNGAYQYTYCGTTKTAAGAVGVRIGYWSSASNNIQYIYTHNADASNC